MSPTLAEDLFKPASDGILPNIQIVTESGPFVVSPPIKAQLYSDAISKSPLENSLSHASLALSPGKVNESVNHNGEAPIAAISLRLMHIARLAIFPAMVLSGK